jgi:chemotaxis methyl-accepting protein methylase
MEDAQNVVERGDASRLIAQVERERGLDLSHYRLSYVERRLGTRLRALQLSTYRQYASYLTEHPEEYARLLDAVTVNVTEFFRDAPVWKVVRDDVLPTLLKAKESAGQRVVRAWSAGCATGEEPYSMAMAIAAAMGDRAGSFLFSVTATDLDPIALHTAETGEYDIAKAEQIPAPDRVRFISTDGKRFHIRPEIRDHVRFRKMNLFADEPPRSLDLIMCRNVFIYFSREQQAKVTAMFHKALARGGYLVLGRTEKMPPEVAGQFTPVNSKERVYQKV